MSETVLAVDPAELQKLEITKPVAIEVENVSLAYEIYKKPVDMLKEALFGGVRHDRFWALRGVDLKIFEGERIGIVGPNGAGKSTLLKVICGTLRPTIGMARTQGRVSSLLSMVPAWNEDETGIENIKYNLMMRGVSGQQIPALVDDIIEFTELGQFIFHPVKTYSTGMSARLSFGIATATEPDILIIDEVLGTGDGYFAWKAMKRMQDFCARGRAMVFVSHSMAAVQQMCDRVIWMQNGSVRLSGEAGYVLKQYELDFRRSEDETMRAAHVAKRAGQGSKALADEVTEEGVLRFRLVPRTGGHFFSTHFVRSIAIEWPSGSKCEVPLERVDINTAQASLELNSSEWGRLQERAGHLCRTLQRVTGRNFGGQFVVRVPAIESQDGATTATITVEAFSDRSEEALTLEMLEVATGRWQQVEAGEQSASAGGLRRSIFRAADSFAPPGIREDVIRNLKEEEKPAAEILSVEVVGTAGDTAVIVEEEPFEVRVRVRFQRSPPMADASIKITRMDGVYVFWQSSGQCGVNVEEPKGERVFRFVFEPNLIGAGHYTIGAYVANGWHYPENYPYSEVFARAIDVATFRIVPKLTELDCGILNQRVKVIFE